ncbi:carboxypeptidase [Erythrobacter sp. SCSIO 43205]|uniref:M14 family metallopeptidase n=1 Tax=Erythrobacter sp. SCSIO 43205 TaxID=2779361 RepID=UPI001CA7D5C0|nr:M14 family metallopeptidase [Erythrobacter sp. SCSIO 43205]UAB78823.1 carboxypeptidase [Erythrobacter sp. SCSIO 43205]
MKHHLVRRIAAFVAFGFASISLAGAALAQSFVEAEFDPSIPTLTQLIGHQPGERITSPEETVRYLEALVAAAPDRARMMEYATSWQGRPLHYVVLTAPENMARIDAIRADMANIAAGRPSNGDALPVTWLAYSVHGNEIASTDAAIMMAYHLLAATNDPRVQEIMSKTIVVLDPVQNPDGRARFVSHFRNALGLEPIGDRQAAEHDETWPSGRVNHYMFDLNRDWFTLSQPETRGKVKAMLEWNPVVVADVHEMGGDETYFFAPAADPVNPNITSAQLSLYELIGRNNARNFDQIGEPYFTREVFDLFYPGYGDTWNAHQGAIGMTYEQGSSRGLVWERRDGTVLPYAAGVRNHFVASLSTAEAVAMNAERFLSDYAQYRRANANGSTGSGAYVIDLSQRRWNAEHLGRRLALQGVEVLRQSGPASVCGRSYPQGYIAVPQAQPSGKLVRSLLDKNTQLPREFVVEQEKRRSVDLDHELYDVTAWSVGAMSGVKIDVCNGALGGTPLTGAEPIASVGDASAAYAVAVPWTDSGQARLVALALREGIEASSTDEAFTKNGRTFPRGTVLFPVARNTPEKMARLRELAAEIGAETVALGDSWVEDGPNLGSSAFKRLAVPKIAIAWDEGVSQLSAGALRYVIEQRLGLPVVPIRTNRFGRADLSDYDVVIVPDGSPRGAMGSGGISNLRSFVAGGGVLVAVGNSLRTFASGEDALLSVEREAALGRSAKDESAEAGSLTKAEEIKSEEEYRELIADQQALPDTLPGALLNTVADTEHFLSAGYDGGAVVLASGSQIFTPLDRSNGSNVMRFAAADALVESGYVWDENRRQLAFKPYMMAQGTGRGMTIGFAHDPSTRAFLDGLDLLIANAVLVAPSRVR